jgi:nicotinate-nucleotide--dimethylbenzimidazole phosphoribosyltransferase
MKRISEIQKPDETAMEKAGQRLDSLVKPIGSLGDLETMAIRLSGITGSLYNDLKKKAVVVFAADNGVWEEGITPVPQAVTAMQATNMAKGVAGISVLTRYAGADLKIIDIGVKDALEYTVIENRRIKSGTGNIAKGPAMTRQEAEKAVLTGLEAAKSCKEAGYAVLGVGEMGICNTSTSSAVLCALTGLSVEAVTGRGAGIDDAQFDKKIGVIKNALALNHPDKGDVLEVLQKVGGLDIAGMAGFFLGAAHYRIPVVIDGFISAVAALAAYRLNPAVREYMFTSHKSYEIGYNAAIAEIGLKPVFDLSMRLGEGTGCPFTFFCLEASQCIIREMATFEEGNIDDSGFVDIREEEK